MKRLICALILLAALPAWAAEINATAKLSWTVPATRENGSTLKPTDIASYKVRWGTAPGKTLSTIPVTGTSYDWAAPLTIGTDGTVTAYFTSTGANLNALTSGSVTLELLYTSAITV